LTIEKIEVSNKATLPKVLYRFDHSEDLEDFVAEFRQHFDLLLCGTDEQATAELEAHSDQIIALVLDQDVFDSPLPALAKSKRTNILSMQLHQDVALDSIVELLENGFINKCFSKPYDSKVIRSEVYAASLGLSSQRLNYSDKASQRYGVLIVDDETVATKFLLKQLERLECPCDILVAEDAEQALEIVEREKHNLAVIISDQRMPGMQGNQLLSEIQRTNPHIIRMLTSAYEEIDIALNAVNEGRIFRYIRKPWDAKEINALIKLSLFEFKARIAQANEQQSNLSRQFIEVLAKRRVALNNALQVMIDGVGGDGTLQQFFVSLDDVTVLPPSQGSLRAIHETSIEADLVINFSKHIATQLSTFSHQSVCSNNTGERVLSMLSNRMSSVEFLNLESPDSSAYENAASLSSDEQLAEKIVSCLRLLLDSSGLAFSDLELSGNEVEVRIATRNGIKVRLFRHILSAQSQLSSQMLLQQSAMLLLITFCRLIGAEVQFRGGEQNFALQILLKKTRSDSSELVR